MRAGWLEQFGDPGQVLTCQEVPDPGAPGSDEVLLDLVASPVNPADLLTLQGLYAVLPELPGAAGMEGVARVTATGGSVRNVGEGDLVLLPLGVGAWQERFRVSAAGLMVLPPEVDPLQAAMLTVNPPTAHLLLTTMVPLQSGDWVIQNAANSAVGRLVIQMARSKGYRTVNVVRREGLEDTLTQLGADVVLVDGEDLAQRVAAATSGARIRLALDATAGTGTMRLAACIATGATVVNYGVLTMEPCQLSALQTIFEDKRLRGCWVAHWYAQSSAEEVTRVLTELGQALADRSLHAAVDATYPVADVVKAVAHAGQAHRDGKIMLTGPGWSPPTQATQ